MHSLRIGVTYDLRSDYLALGYGEEETAEFDAEETIAAICGALAGAGPSTRAHRRHPAPDRSAGQRRALGRGVQYLRGSERRGAGGAGAGAAGGL